MGTITFEGETDCSDLDFQDSYDAVVGRCMDDRWYEKRLNEFHGRNFGMTVTECYFLWYDMVKHGVIWYGVVR